MGKNLAGAQVYPRAVSPPDPPPPPPLPAPSDASKFEILNTCFVVDGKSTELAHCPRLGARVARRVLRGAFGEPLVKYWRVSADPGVAPEPLASAMDDLGTLCVRRREDLATDPRRRLGRIEPTPQRAEFTRFAAEWPHVAAAMRLVDALPPQRFQGGEPLHQRLLPGNPDPRGISADWVRLLARHLSGDFGDYGEYVEDIMEDPERVFLIGMAAIAERNSLAIRQGSGAVRSRYPLDDHPGLAANFVTGLGAGCTLAIVLPADATV